MSSSTLPVVVVWHRYRRGTNEVAYTAQPGVTLVDGTDLVGRLAVTSLNSWSALPMLAPLPTSAVDIMMLPPWKTLTSAMGSVRDEPPTDAATTGYWHRLGSHWRWQMCSERTDYPANQHGGTTPTSDDDEAWSWPRRRVRMWPWPRHQRLPWEGGRRLRPRWR